MYKYLNFVKYIKSEQLVLTKLIASLSMSNFLEISQRYTLHLFFIFPFCWLFLGIAEITVSSGGRSGGSGRRALFVMLMVGIKDFKMPRRRR